MVKNIILAFYTILLIVAVTVYASGRLAWVPEDERFISDEDRLKKAIEMHKPEILQMGDVPILHVPTSKMTGQNWSVNHAFYVYEEGVLKRIDLNSK